MERLTSWMGEHAAVVDHHANYIDRLAAYEDTGLTPEKVKQLVDAIRKHEVVFLTEEQCLKSMLIKVDGQWTDFTIAELQDILRAKREDRMVVLPYKAADKDSRFYLTRLQSLSATEKNAFLMGKWNYTSHPCERCDTGWGSAGTDGVHTCKETCERLAAWNKKQEKEG